MAHKMMTAARPFRYGNRMLTAGEPVLMSGPKARLHASMGDALPGGPGRRLRAKVEAPSPTPTPTPVPPAPTPTPSPASVPSDNAAPVLDLPALRAAYEARFGKKPFNGWKEETLREKLAAE